MTAASPHWPTFIVVCICFSVDKADQSLLPAVYFELCRELGAGPALLSLVTMARGLVQAAVAIFAGPLGNKFSRVKVVGFGCIAWGLATAGVGAARSVPALMLGRAVNGLGLGLVVPVAQALVSDMFPDAQRGRAFGVLNLFGNLGGMLGGLFATSVAAGSVGLLAGWRFAFHAVAALSCAVGLLVLGVGREARVRRRSAPLVLRNVVRDLGAVARLRTFCIIILQGAFGSMPWFALGFMTLLFELLGFSHAETALLTTAFYVGATGGVLLGGVLADVAARRSPSHGRVVVAQVSSGAGIPLFLLILFGLPAARASFAVYIVVLFTTGATISWCAPLNQAIMAEITNETLRSTIYGLDRVLEGLFAPAGTALAGFLAEVAFGFRQSAACGDDAEAASGEAARGAAGGNGDANAHALATSLAVLTAVPWSICFLSYSLLHLVYPADRKRALAAAEPQDGQALAGPTGAVEVGMGTVVVSTEAAKL